MGYRATNRLDEMFDSAPLHRSARRITARCIEALDDGAARRTPVAKPPPGVGGAAFAAQRGRPPGTAKSSWRHTDVDVGRSPTGVTRFSGEAYSEDPLMPLIEWPTRPHIIRPRPDRAPASVRATRRPRRAGTDPAARLRYVSRGGRVVYAREVHHPGTDGQHMMRDSLAELDGTWTSRIGEEEVRLWAREQARLVGT